MLPAEAAGDGGDGGMMDGTEDDDDDVIAKALSTRLRRLARFVRPRARFKLRLKLFQWELLRLYRLVRVCGWTCFVRASCVLRVRFVCAFVCASCVLRACFACVQLWQLVVKQAVQRVDSELAHT